MRDRIAAAVDVSFSGPSTRSTMGLLDTIQSHKIPPGQVRGHPEQLEVCGVEGTGLVRR